MMICACCEKDFTPNSSRGEQRFCSPACRWRAKNRRQRAGVAALSARPDADLGNDTGPSTASRRDIEADAANPAPQRVQAVADMLNPTIEAIRRELAEQKDIVWTNNEIRHAAWRMRVAPTAVRNALNPMFRG